MNLQRSCNITVMVMALSAVSGCTDDAVTGPPTVRLGRDQCAECGMLISEERSSTAMLILVQNRREYLLFDDIGCMLDLEGALETGREVLDRFVHDHQTQRWLPANTSWFVVASPDRLPTPMGSGIAAFGQQATAEHANREYAGKVVTWSDLRQSRVKGVSAAPGSPATAPTMRNDNSP